MPRRITSSAGIYMAYLVRYVHQYPVTVAELQHMAAERNFPRLVAYFSKLPADRTYPDVQAILDDFAKYQDASA